MADTDTIGRDEIAIGLDVSEAQLNQKDRSRVKQIVSRIEREKGKRFIDITSPAERAFLRNRGVKARRRGEYVVAARDHPTAAPKETTVTMSDIDRKTVSIIGLDVAGAKRPLNLSDMALVETIQRRIDSGARTPADVMTREEMGMLDDLGVEAKIEFALDETAERLESLAARKKIEKRINPETGEAEYRKKGIAPTLADDYLFTKKRTMVSDKTDERAKQLLRGNDCQRFVLTEASAIKVGEAIRAYPELLVDQGEFARTPFPTCWIEFPSHGFHEAVVPGSVSSRTLHADDRVGYLFHGNTVYVVASNRKTKHTDIADLSPMVYHLHEPMSLKAQLDLADRFHLSRGQLDNFFWGGMMTETLDQRTLRGLRDQHGVSVMFDPKFEGMVTGEELLGFTAGEVRNIIGLLLMLNQPSTVLHREAVERRRTNSIRGTRVMMAHSVITINLDKRSRPDRLLRPPLDHGRSGPRYHEVTDHWCHDRVARSRGYNEDDERTWGRGDHAHLYERDEPHDNNHYTCRICGGKRWRRLMKGRGNREKGIVTQTRVVKTDADANVRSHQFA